MFTLRMHGDVFVSGVVVKGFYVESLLVCLSALPCIPLVEQLCQCAHDRTRHSLERTQPHVKGFVKTLDERKLQRLGVDASTTPATVGDPDENAPTTFLYRSDKFAECTDATSVFVRREELVPHLTAFLESLLDNANCTCISSLLCNEAKHL